MTFATKGKNVAGFLNSLFGLVDSLVEAAWAKETTLPICSLLRRKPIKVFYKYYKDKPLSHCLVFRQGKRSMFVISLPRYGEDISQICAVTEGQEYRKAGGDTVFGFWPRLAIRLAAGKPVSCHNISAGVSVEIDVPLCKGSSKTTYRVAYCRKGMRESMILVATRYSSQSSTYNKRKSARYAWFKLSLEEFKMLAKHLDSFMNSKEFADVMKNEIAE